jgi:hypothetical protein
VFLPVIFPFRVPGSGFRVKSQKEKRNLNMNCPVSTSLILSFDSGIFDTFCGSLKNVRSPQ